jgi:threonine dehydrogenase-like Zn-dependent dehydrogenase
MGAEKIIAMSRHESRQRIAHEFGATQVVAERGDEGEAAVLEITDGIGADADGYRAMDERRSIKVQINP